LIIVAVAGSAYFAIANQHGGGTVPFADASGFSVAISETDSPIFVRRAELGVDADFSTTFGFSLDGHKLVAGANNFLSIWDVSSKAAGSLYLKDNSSEYTAAAFSTDNHTVAYGTFEGQLRLWDSAKPNEPPLSLQLADQPLWDVAFSPDGQWLAASCAASSVKIRYVTKVWDLTKGEPTLSNGVDLHKNFGEVTSVAFTPDSSLLATGGLGGEVFLWDMQHLDQNPVRLSINTQGVSDFDENGVQSLALSSDRLLAASTNDGLIWLWNLKQPSASPAKFDLFSYLPSDEKEKIPSNMLDGRAVAFSPDGKMLVAGYGDGSVHAWMLSKGVVQGELSTARVLNVPRGSSIKSIRFSPDGTILAVMSTAGIKLWDIEQPTHIAEATP
jgi:WD40 repeat protein